MIREAVQDSLGTKPFLLDFGHTDASLTRKRHVTEGQTLEQACSPTNIKFSVWGWPPKSCGKWSAIP